MSAVGLRWQRQQREIEMSRFKDFVPHGVIPAVLLPFRDDLSIDEHSFRSHLRDVTAVEGLSALTINAHSTEVASCTSEEQTRVLEITAEDVGSKLPIMHGVWADGSLEAARIAKRAQAGGSSALLVFPPAPFTLGQNADMAVAHFKTIASASDLPLIVFQYPLATGQGYPAETLARLFNEVPTIRAIKDWTSSVQQHETQIPVRNDDVVLMFEDDLCTRNRALTDVEPSGEVHAEESPYGLFAFDAFQALVFET